MDGIALREMEEVTDVPVGKAGTANWTTARQNGG